MGQVGSKIGERAWPLRQAGTRKVMVTKEEKHRTLTKKKKRPKKSDTEKKEKKSHFGHRGARPHGLPKRT